MTVALPLGYLPETMKGLNLGTVLLLCCATPLVAAAQRSAAAADEQVLLLRESHTVLRGVVSQLGDQVVVRQRDGEVRLPVDRVACWADSLAGLYQYQLERRRGATLEQHLALARWCLHHGYLPGAAHELAAARLLAPDSPAVAKNLERYFAALQTPRPHVTDSDPQLTAEEQLRGTSGASDPGSEPHVLADSAAATAPDAARHDSGDLEAHLESFTATIQPLLINRCADCHGSGSRNAFVFESPTPGRRQLTSDVTQKNLSAVAAWVDREYPSASPLLVRALQAHGGLSAPPLGPRNQLAIQRLRSWVRAVASGPRWSAPGSSNLASNAESTENEGASLGESLQLPTRLPMIKDPFDPDVFNRRIHTGRMP